MGWWRRLAAWADISFRRPWPLLAYSPLLYLAVWGAAIRLWISPTAPPDFDTIIGHGSYGIWLGLGVCSPPLALLSWWLITHRAGHWRYRGMWFRLASDVGVFTVLLAFHLTVVISIPPASEARIFSRYIVAASLLFSLGLVIRDVWSLVLTERIARRMDRDG